MSYSVDSILENEEKLYREMQREMLAKGFILKCLITNKIDDLRSAVFEKDNRDLKNDLDNQVTFDRVGVKYLLSCRNDKKKFKKLFNMKNKLKIEERFTQFQAFCDVYVPYKEKINGKV